MYEPPTYEPLHHGGAAFVNGTETDLAPDDDDGGGGGGENAVRALGVSVIDMPSATSAKSDYDREEEELQMRLGNRGSKGAPGAMRRFRDSMMMEDHVVIRFEQLHFEAGLTTVLHKLNGCFGPAKLVAVMGASGSGKTSLLNILAGNMGSHQDPKQQQTTKVRGKIFLNERPVDSKVLRKVSAYCTQHDSLLPHLTAREVLWDAASLRLPVHCSVAYRNERVQEVLDLLELNECADTLTGNPVSGLKGLSGGQRRRLSIAVELFSRPKLLFCDEPTTGLDARTAFDCVAALKRLASTGRTVVVVLHQPSSKLFSLFDDVVLLAQGDIIFQGPTQDVTSFFAEQGIMRPAFYNPADFLIDVAHEQVGPVLSVIVGAYKKRLQEQQEAEAVVFSQLPAIKYPKHRYPVPGRVMFQALLTRCFTTMQRDGLLVKFAVQLLLGFAVGMLYFQMGSSSLTEVLDRVSLLFFAQIFLALNTSLSTVMTFPTERAVIEKEHRNNMYSLMPYYAARTMADVMYQLVFPVAFGSSMYWIAGLNSDPTRFLEFLFTLMLQTLVTQAIGLLVSLLCNKLIMAIIQVPMFIFPHFLFGGFLANLDGLPKGLAWLQWLSFARYSFENLMLGEFDDVDFSDNVVLQRGDDVIELFGLHRHTYARNCTILITYAIVLRVAGYLILRRKLKKHVQ